MMIRTFAGAAALCMSAGLVAAQGFSGAELSAEVLAFTEDVDFGETRYAAGAEFELFGGFSIEADIAYHGFRALDIDTRNVTLHGIYTLSSGLDAGLFYGRDSVDGGDGSINTLGIEAASSFAGAGVEGYLGRYDGENDTSGNVLAVGAGYGLGDRLAAKGFAGLLSGDIEASRIGLGAEYRLGSGPSLFAEVGRLGTDGESQTFVSLGARIAIGPNDGTTFGSRGIFEIIPGL